MSGTNRVHLLTRPEWGFQTPVPRADGKGCLKKKKPLSIKVQEDVNVAVQHTRSMCATAQDRADAAGQATGSKGSDPAIPSILAAGRAFETFMSCCDSNQILANVGKITSTMRTMTSSGSQEDGTDTAATRGYSGGMPSRTC